MKSIGVREGRAPRELSGPVLGMVLFVASEAMFFGAFFGAYFTIRSSLDQWPPAGITAPEIGIPAVLTAILISSSVVLQIGLLRMRTGDPRRGTVFLGGTIALGVLFLALQLYDYSTLDFGVKDGVYGTLFYVMTGLHMAHVFGGVVFLTLVFGQSASGLLTRTQHDAFEAGTIYWHFVDVVWIGLFTVFYLLTPR